MGADDAGEQMVTDLVLGANATTSQTFPVTVGSPQGHSGGGRERISAFLTRVVGPIGIAQECGRRELSSRG